MGREYNVQIALYRNSHHEDIRNIKNSIRKMVTRTVNNYLWCQMDISVIRVITL